MNSVLPTTPMKDTCKDRQIDRQIDRQTDRYIDTWIEGQEEVYIERETTATILPWWRERDRCIDR